MDRSCQNIKATPKPPVRRSSVVLEEVDHPAKLKGEIFHNFVMFSNNAPGTKVEIFHDGEKSPLATIAFGDPPTRVVSKTPTNTLKILITGSGCGGGLETKPHTFQYPKVGEYAWTVLVRDGKVRDEIGSFE